jgi:fido (protein-threonine AMPylation protein)
MRSLFSNHLRAVRSFALALLFLAAFHSQVFAATCEPDYSRLAPGTQYVMSLLDKPMSPEKREALEARWRKLEKLRQQYPWRKLPIKRKLWDLRHSHSETVTGSREKEDPSAALANITKAELTVRQWIRKGYPITLERISKLHGILGKGLFNNGFVAGVYRNVDLITSLRSQLLYPAHRDVRALMKDFDRWYNANKDTLHPIELAALAHQRLVSIHPFFDGNGRVCRAVMDWILQSHGYPPPVYFDKLSFFTTQYQQRSPEQNYPPERAAEAATLGLEQSYGVLLGELTTSGEKKAE